MNDILDRKVAPIDHLNGNGIWLHVEAIDRGRTRVVDDTLVNLQLRL